MKESPEVLTRELQAIADIQQRIDRVAEDFDSGANRYAAVDDWKLGELLGLDWDDTADWNRTFWAYKRDDDYSDPLPDFVIAHTTIRSSNSIELTFEVGIGDGGEPFDARSPYSLQKGKGHNPEEFVEVS